MIPCIYKSGYTMSFFDTRLRIRIDEAIRVTTAYNRQFYATDIRLPTMQCKATVTSNIGSKLLTSFVSNSEMWNLIMNILAHADSHSDCLTDEELDVLANLCIGLFQHFDSNDITSFLSQNHNSHNVIRDCHKIINSYNTDDSYGVQYYLYRIIIRQCELLCEHFYKRLEVAVEENGDWFSISDSWVSDSHEFWDCVYHGASVEDPDYDKKDALHTTSIRFIANDTVGVICRYMHKRVLDNMGCRSKGLKCGNAFDLYAVMKLLKWVYEYILRISSCNKPITLIDVTSKWVEYAYRYASCKQIDIINGIIRDIYDYDLTTFTNFNNYRPVSEVVGALFSYDNLRSCIMGTTRFVIIQIPGMLCKYALGLTGFICGDSYRGFNFTGKLNVLGNINLLGKDDGNIILDGASQINYDDLALWDSYEEAENMAKKLLHECLGKKYYNGFKGVISESIDKIIDSGYAMRDLPFMDWIRYKILFLYEEGKLSLDKFSGEPNPFWALVYDNTKRE